MTLIRSFVCAAAGLALVMSACGGDDAGPDPGDVTPEVSATPGTRSVTPFPQPMVAGNRIESPAKGYAANLPEGWNVRPNHIQTFDASVDAFFEPLKPGAGFQPNIAVTCLVVRPDSAEEWQTSIKTNTARQGLNENIQESTRQVAGMQATVLSYINVSQAATAALRLDKQDFLFRGPICDYTITTTALEGQRAEYQPQFDAFVDSFQLVP